MPEIQDNLDMWGQNYPWDDHGDEWSQPWGSSSQLWWGALFPRLHYFLPAGTVLEIAPGYGRCTVFLAPAAERLILVDLAESCITACRMRFGNYDHIEYHVNDGKSLAMVERASVDFVFSYDSLVHVEQDALEGYVAQLGDILRPDGAAFLHHSNMGEYVDPITGRLMVENRHWRATTTSAATVRRAAESAGLSCRTQELLNWGAPETLSDCFSVLTRVGSRWDKPLQTVTNREWMSVASQNAEIARLYGPA